MTSVAPGGTGHGVTAVAPGRPRRSLAWRIGLLLGLAVVVVLLIVGLVVNRVVSHGYDTVLADQQQQRLDDAAVTLADRVGRPAAPLRAARSISSRASTPLCAQVTRICQP